MAKSAIVALKRPAGVKQTRPKNIGKKKAGVPVFVLAPGASNRTSDAVKQLLQAYGEVHAFVYPGAGAPNLMGRRQQCLDAHGKAVDAAAKKWPDRPVWLAGVSFGARCAAELLATSASLPKGILGLLAFGYPLVAIGDQTVADVKKRKQDRTTALKALPKSKRVLLLSSKGDPFLGGDNGKLISQVARQMSATCTCELLPGRDHQPVTPKNTETVNAILQAFLR
mmetsp:Transcript_51112/g.115173  ORF Transcript_51112/g.115173 Transcript_51112/m.115173 type:complete len:225 (-) Transcript_51112:268-942(-)